MIIDYQINQLILIHNREMFIYIPAIIPYDEYMNTVFSITGSPALSMPVSLKAMWILEADRSYDIVKNRPLDILYIAIRTINGAGIIELEGKEPIRLTGSTLFIIRNDKLRKYRCADECWDFYWFEFDVPPDIKLPLDKLMNAEIYENESLLVNECLKMLRQDEYSTSLISSSILSALLNVWTRDNTAGTSEKKPYENIIKETAEYIRSNLDKKLSVLELAKQTKLCERRFRDVFTSVFAVSPKRYIERYRQQAAKALLSNTALSIGDISEQLGYSSQFHFSREFKKHTGSSPSVYRNTKQK